METDLYNLFCKHVKLLDVKVDESVVLEQWEQIKQAYTAEDRHYHNLQHLQEMFEFLEAAGCDSPVALFATWYHDFFYNMKNPEEQSALFARSILTKTFKVSGTFADKVFWFIVATKNHQLLPLLSNKENDLKVFLDADMAILAAQKERYGQYADAIRKEYADVPDEEYNQGRRAFLESLDGKMFFTEQNRGFYERLKHNINWELTQLSLAA